MAPVSHWHITGQLQGCYVCVAFVLRGRCNGPSACLSGVHELGVGGHAVLRDVQPFQFLGGAKGRRVRGSGDAPRRLLHDGAAVDVDELAGDEGGARRAQKADGFCDVVGGACVAKGDAADLPVPTVVVLEELVPLGVDESGADGVDAHLVGGQLEGQRLSEAVDGEVGGAVGGGVGQPPAACGG